MVVRVEARYESSVTCSVRFELGDKTVDRDTVSFPDRRQNLSGSQMMITWDRCSGSFFIRRQSC